MEEVTYIEKVSRKRLEDQLQKIEKESTKIAARKYIETEMDRVGFRGITRRISYYLNALSTLEKIDIDTVTPDQVCQGIIKREDQTKHYYTYTKKMYTWIYDNDLSKTMKENHENWFFIKSRAIGREIIEKIARKEIEPYNLIFSSCSLKTDYKCVSMFPLNACNKNAAKLIEDWLYQYYGKRLLNCKISLLLSSFLIELGYEDPLNELSDKDIDYFFKKYKDADSGTLADSAKFFAYVVGQTPLKEKDKRFRLFTVSVMSKRYFSYLITHGYRPVRLDINEDCPKFDKWMVIPDESFKSYSSYCGGDVINFNFSKIINEQLRELVKSYIWASNDKSLKHRNTQYLRLVFFCNTSFPHNKHIDVVPKSILTTYKMYTNKKYNTPNSRHSYQGSVADFFRYTTKNNLLKVSDENWEMLFKENYRTHDYAVSTDTIGEDNFKKILDKVNETRFDSIENDTYATMFDIITNCEIRPMAIPHLSANCIKEGMRKNTYLICSVSKVSKGAIDETPVPRVVVASIRNYLERNKEFRASCNNPDVNDYLFLLRRNNGSYMVPVINGFYTYLKNICNSCGVEMVNPSKLRKEYITRTRVYSMKNGLNLLTELRLTSHASEATVNKHYIQNLVRCSIETANKIVIGDVDVSKNISDESKEYKKEEIVEHECGYCKQTYCNDNGPLSCLLCPSFVATMDRIPFFEKEIARIDEEIDNSSNSHDIESLNSIKKLLCAFLEKLLTIKEENYGK